MYQKEHDNPNFAKGICQDRVDGYMMVKTSPLEMILYNKDGSVASMCGNGIRCLIQYCYEHGIIKDFQNQVLTGCGLIETKIINIFPFMVYVRMNNPLFTYIDNRVYLDEPLRLESKFHSPTYHISLVDVGVWHGIIIPDDFEKAQEDAKAICDLPLFKNNLNVDIVKITNDIYVKTYERGVGFTQACGTGVMATFIILKKLNRIKENKIQIHTDGGMIEAGMDEKGYYIVGPSRYEII